MTTSITATVAISALTSAIISITTFVIGVRMSKDQGDRPALRAIYQRLFEHFEEMRKAIKDGEERDWSSYPRKRDQYVTPVRSIQQSGEVNLLPREIALECEIVERQTLSAGSKLKKWLRATYIPHVRPYLAIVIPAGNRAIPHRPYRMLRVSRLSSFSESELDAFIEEINSQQLGIGIEFALDPGRTDLWFIYPEYVPEGNWTPLLREVWNRGHGSSEAAGLHSSLRGAAAAIDQLIATLEVRIRDPHPLMESVRRSLSDAIRGR